jgi:hypothetical protein
VLPWIANAELEMRLALDRSQEAFCLVAKHDHSIVIASHRGGADIELALGLLDAYAGAAMRWLDDLSSRSREDEGRVKALWDALELTWEHLDPDTHPALAPILAVAKRLRGLP